MNVQYARHAPLWDYVEDCYHGAERVKEGPNAEEYLPCLVSHFEAGDLDVTIENFADKLNSLGANVKRVE